MDQLQAWFKMVPYLIDRGKQAYLVMIIFKVFSEFRPGALNSNMIISLKVLLFLVRLENCNHYD